MCHSNQLSCAVSGLSDGTYSYTVRSRNAENQGDVLPAAGGAGVASPPTQPAPIVRETSKRRFTITVSVHAETQMRPSPESPPSARFTVR